MTPSGAGSGIRLDSWKAIAAYLGRDAGTVRRWERTRGLPVHRVPGGKGSSVFAFTHEVDAWLQSASPEPAIADQSLIETEEADTPARWWRWGVVTAMVSLVLLSVWWVQRPRASVAETRVALSTEALTASTTDGRSLWTYPLDPAYRHYRSEVNNASAVVGGASPRIYFITSHRERRTDETAESGEFTSLNIDGTPRFTFRFDDHLKIG